MAKKHKSDDPTPNGGVRSEVYYLDDENNMVDEKVATRCEVVELDKDGDIVHRTFGRLGGQTTPPPGKGPPGKDEEGEEVEDDEDDDQD